MKNLLCIIVLVALSGCEGDEPKPDPFVGKWQYSHSGLSATFEIADDPLGYRINNPTVNGGVWHYVVLADITKRKKIGQMLIAETTTSPNGFVFFGSTISGNVITSDSVWVSKSGQSRITVKAQTITKF